MRNGGKTVASKSEKKKIQSKIVRDYLKSNGVDYTYEDNSYKYTIYTPKGVIEYWAGSSKWHYIGSSEYSTDPIANIMNRVAL